MMRMIMKVFRERLDELQWGLIVCGVTWLAGNILMAVIFHIDPSKDIFEFSSLIMGIVMLFYVLIVGTFGFAAEFNLAIGMGVSRKRFVPAYLFVSLIYEMLLLGMLCAGYFIEHQELRIFYGLNESRFDRMLFPGFWYLPMALLLLAAVQLFMGSLMLKFGKKVLWVFWLLWMVICMVPGRILEAMKQMPDSMFGRLGHGIVRWTGELGTGGIILITLGVITLLSAGICLMMRRQQVTST